jgi:hypothetical protein
MKTAKMVSLASCMAILLLGCTSAPPPQKEVAPPPPPVVAAPAPEPVPEKPQEPVVVPEPAPVPEPVKTPEAFDPATVSKQEYETTKADIQVLIQKLNDIIQGKDYDTWLSYLTEEYIKEMSDPQFLAQQSESKVLQKFNIKLRTLKDYFFYVVVPSRKSDRVDEISFIGQQHVKAYMFNDKGEKLLLYELEKINNMWKIGVGR